MTRAYLFILASFFWLVGGGRAIYAVLDPKDKGALPDVLLGSLLLGFAILFLIGTALWARAKGYHAILGVILGWVGPLGLLILVFLPNKAQT